MYVSMCHDKNQNWCCMNQRQNYNKVDHLYGGYLRKLMQGDND